MKTILLVFVIAATSAVCLAQSASLTVVNRTNCAYSIKATAADTLCDSICFTMVYCISPNDSLVIPPCSNDSLRFWDSFAVTPATSYPECIPCYKARTTYINSPYGPQCADYPTDTNENPHCSGCFFGMYFVSPNRVEIN